MVVAIAPLPALDPVHRLPSTDTRCAGGTSWLGYSGRVRNLEIVHRALLVLADSNDLAAGVIITLEPHRLPALAAFGHCTPPDARTSIAASLGYKNYQSVPIVKGIVQDVDQPYSTRRSRRCVLPPPEQPEPERSQPPPVAPTTRLPAASPSAGGVDTESWSRTGASPNSVDARTVDAV